jgi:hypothetical protein
MASGSTALYVVQTSDSLQQTGADIGTNGATPPTSITIENMCFQSVDPMNIAFINRASECIFNQVQFIGPLTTADLTVDTDDTACVRFDSSNALDVHQIKFDNCGFSGTTYGISTHHHVRGVGVTGAHFSTLYQGILLEVNPDGDAFSPQGFGITSCDFDTIYAQGIVFYTDRNATAQNTFGDVGNHFGGVTQPYSSIIDFLSPNNISVGDMFQRTTAFSGTYPRIKIFNAATQTVPASIGIDSAAQIQMGSFVRETGTQATLSAGATATTLFTVSTTFIKAFKMDYTIIVETSARTGTMTIANDADDSAGDGLSYTDDFVENSTTGVTLNVTDVGGTVTVSYASDAGRAAGLIYYSLTHLGRSY